MKKTTNQHTIPSLATDPSTQHLQVNIMKSICVFCGSNKGNNPLYSISAHKLGSLLASLNISLVYGGASVGLMGDIADVMIKNGGEVIGVIPKFLLEMEIAHKNLSKLHVVNTMHERKAKMEEIADGFIALPGGLGTLDEFFEILTWSQLGIHNKPCGLLNITGYFDKLIDFFDYSVSQGFIRKEHRDIIFTEDDPAVLINKMLSYTPKRVNKWLDINMV